MIRKGIFYDMGIPVSEENAKELETIITDVVKMRGQECSEIWKKVSRWLDDPTLRETLRKKIVNNSPTTPRQFASTAKP
jgi:hypothetical protein